MSRRVWILLLIGYLALDFATPLLPGVMSFDAGDLEAVRAVRDPIPISSDRTTGIPLPSTPERIAEVAIYRPCSPRFVALQPWVPIARHAAVSVVDLPPSEDAH